MPPPLAKTSRLQSDSPGSRGLKITDVSKALRRLRIHFPAFGDGFLYLVLRECDFDCCDALDALRTGKLPKCLESIPTRLDLIEARKICADENRHPGVSETDRASLESDRDPLVKQTDGTPVYDVEDVELPADEDCSWCTSEESDGSVRGTVGTQPRRGAVDDGAVAANASACSVVALSGGHMPASRASRARASGDGQFHGGRQRSTGRLVARARRSGSSSLASYRSHSRSVVASDGETSESETTQSSEGSAISSGHGSQYPDSRHADRECNDVTAQQPAANPGFDKVDPSARLCGAPNRRRSASSSTEECHSPLFTARRRRHRFIADDHSEPSNMSNPDHLLDEAARQRSGPPTPSSLFSGSVGTYSLPTSASIQLDNPADPQSANDAADESVIYPQYRGSVDGVENRPRALKRSPKHLESRRTPHDSGSLFSSSASSPSSNASLVNGPLPGRASPGHGSLGTGSPRSTASGSCSPRRAGVTSSNKDRQRMSLLEMREELLNRIHPQRRQIRLIDTPVPNSRRSYAGDMPHASGAASSSLQMMHSAVPEVYSYPIDPSRYARPPVVQAKLIDEGPPSPAIASQFEKRKQLSERLRQHEVGGVAATSNPHSQLSEAAADHSVYTNPLPFFFIADDAPNIDANGDDSNNDEKASPRGVPHPELHGFRWSSKKRRFCRDAASSLPTVLRPRHVFMLGPAIYKKLYGYQILAVAWMFELFKLRAGGILGDEMGLGKTVQACGFIRGLVSSGLATSFIILLPLTLLEQWKSHLRMWCPNVEIIVFHGTERKSALHACMTTASPMAVLTTYETFRNAHHDIGRAPRSSCGPRTRMEQEAEQEGFDDPEGWREQILQDQKANDERGSQPWDVAIFDEAHKIKNPKNQAAQAVRLLDAHCRLLLTGTPVSNKLDELWALMDCANPGLLGNQKTFAREFADPIKAGSARHAPDHAVHRKNRIALELQKIIKPYILRRTTQGTLGIEDQRSDNSPLDKSPKSTPLPRTLCLDPHPIKGVNDLSESRGLPPKKDIIVWLELTPQQQEIYSLYLESRQVTSIFSRSHQGVRGFNSMQAVGILLKLCRHPVFLLPRDLQTWSKQCWSMESGGPVPNGQSDEDEIQDSTREQWYEAALDINQTNPDSLIAASGKLRFLYSALPALQTKGHRCLIFSQSTRMLDMVDAVVMKRLELRFLRIDGSVSADLRHLRIKEFSRNPTIFAMLMTTKVGGQGLNLTSADRVIMIDPDWSPTNDNQAVARAHRIGQTKPVVIYRLFTSGAIEDHAFRLQTFKQGIAKTAMENTNQKTYFSHTEMAQMFTLRSRGDSETLRILDSVNQTERSEKELEEVMRNDIGKDAFEELSAVLGGLSDFDCLYNGLARQTAPSQEYDKLAMTSRLKLQTESYDETQTMSADWLRRACLKMRK